MVICWGFNFVSLKLVYQQMPASAVSLFRFILMWLALAGLCRIRGESIRPPKEGYFRFLLVGMMSMGLYMIPFLEGLARTTPAETAIMLSTAPIFTVLIAAMFKQEKLTVGILVATFISFAGVTLVLLGGTHHAVSAAGNPMLGNGLVLLSALVWACATVLGRPYLTKFSPIQVLTISMPGALPILLIYGGPDLLKVPWHEFTWVTWTNLAQVVFCSGVLAFVCFYEGVRKIGTGRATMYQFFVPILATFFGILILKQTPSTLQVLGLVVVISGVWVASIARNRTARLVGDTAEPAP